MGEKIYDVEVARLISEGRLAEQYKVISRRLDSVSKENRNLKRQIEDLEAIIADGKKPDVSVSENGVSDGCECGGYHLAKERIAELEKENSALKEKLSIIRTRTTAEARDFWDKDMFGSLVVTVPNKSNDNAIIEKMEEDLNRLTMDLKNRMGQIYELREENKILQEEKDRLAEMINDLLEDDTSELEEKLKNACGENQQLKITVDVLSKRIAELMEVHEF